jgi:hypothetical protein
MNSLDEHQIIWLGADATSYAAQCERCREDHRWAEQIVGTLVEGTLRPQADVGFTSCSRGHRIRVRRISRLRAVSAA